MKYEATSCVLNFLSNCSGNAAQYLVSKNILELILENLTESHTKLLKESLKVLIKLFEFGEGLKDSYDCTNPYVWRVANSNGAGLVENLQNHNDQAVHNLAHSIFEIFFPSEVVK